MVKQNIFDNKPIIPRHGITQIKYYTSFQKAVIRTKIHTNGISSHKHTFNTYTYPVIVMGVLCHYKNT